MNKHIFNLFLKHIDFDKVEKEIKSLSNIVGTYIAIYLHIDPLGESNHE